MNKKTSVLVLLTLFFLANPARLLAKNYFVTLNSDNDCSDDNCGLQAALTEAASNGQDDTIQISAGVFEISGVPLNHKNFEPSSSETFLLEMIGAGPAETILKAKGDVLGAAILWIGNLRDFKIENVGFEDGESFGLPGLLVEGGSSVQINHCSFSHNAGGAIIRNGPDEVTVTGCAFNHNNGQDFGGLAITGGAAGRVFVGSSTFYDNSSTTLSGGADVNAFESFEVVNNIFWGNINLGATLTTQEGNEGSILVKVANNTFFKNQSSINGDVCGGVLIRLFSDLSVAEVANNIIQDSISPSGATVNDFCFDAAFADFHNDGKGGLVKLLNNNFGKLKTFCFECSAQKEESGSINKNPLFLDPNNGDFHLQTTSPCVNAGISDTSFVLPELDLDGNPRIFGSAPDMGAFELQEDPSPGSGSGGSGSSGGCSLIR